MLCKSIETPERLGGCPDGEGVSSSAACLKKFIKSENDRISQRKSKVRKEGEQDYTNEINELVLTWLMEDLDITAETCHAEPVDVFEDLLALILSDTPTLHRPDTDYADAVRQLKDWFFEDIGSVARSFDVDPLDVLVDAFRLIVSETFLADRVIEKMAKYGTALGEGKRSSST